MTLNPILNRQARAADTTLVTDDELHSRLRRQLIEPMRPRALEAVREQLEARAVDRVDGIVGRGRFEAMSELASHLPVIFVAELGKPVSADNNTLFGFRELPLTLVPRLAPLASGERYRSNG